MRWGGQIKAMAIGLLRLALGPVASDTQWDIEGSGVPAVVAAAAAAAAARGGGARERRGLARGTKVAIAVGGPRTVVGSQRSGTRPGAAAAATAGHSRGCPASLRHRPSGAHPGAAFVGVEGGRGETFLRGS